MASRATLIAKGVGMDVSQGPDGARCRKGRITSRNLALRPVDHSGEWIID